MQKHLISLVMLSLLAACASNKPAEVTAVTSKGEDSQAQSKPSTSANTNSSSLNPPSARAIDPLLDKNNILSKRSVYFDYDKYEIRDEFRSLIEAHAKHLRSNPNRSIRIEGNADERGSAEYNLALGQKRSEAVRRAITTLGAQDKQIEATSNGEEKPRANGGSEEAWAQNRRADVVYNGE